MLWKIVKRNKDFKKFRRARRLSKIERVNRNRRRVSVFKPYKSYQAYSRATIHIDRHSETVKLEKYFELLVNTQDVISRMDELKSYKYRNDILGVKIDLHDVETIDIGAISLLLSSVEELSLYDKHVSGNVPTNEHANNVLTESGFFKNISNVSRRITNQMKTNNNKNFLLIGYPKTKGKGRLIGEGIKSSIGVLSGKPQHYKAAYTMVMEMNANSIEHAYEEGKKHWVFGINFQESSNRLYFTFTDNGVGILNQLNIKVENLFVQLLKDCNYNTALVLQNLFDKKYNSRFKNQINRNRGLPIIQQKVAQNNVENLICITNDVYLHLQNRSSLKLSSEFSGTFYYWELDLNLFLKNGGDTDKGSRFYGIS